MVYKRYIKRGGKIYGPYSYESRRVDGKVVSSYVRPKRNIFPIVFVSIFALFILSLLVFSSFYFTPSGKITLHLSPSYFPNQTLEGQVKITLSSGELIPSDSIVILNLGNQQKQFLLSDLIDSETISGDFYSESAVISGNGLGYGVIGEMVVYPEVFFDLRITDSIDVDDNEINDDGIDDNESSDDMDGGSDGIDDIPVDENTPDDILVDDESVDDSISDDSDDGSAPLTGNSVLDDSDMIISGNVSKFSDFVYSLDSGQSAEIIEGSVMNSDGDLIDENELVLEQSDDSVLVRTDYSVVDYGFGENYSGDETESFFIDLSVFNVSSEVGDLNFEIFYQNVSIVSTSVSLSEDMFSLNQTNETLLNETTLNETVIFNETIINETILNETINLTSDGLILLMNFSDFSLGINETLNITLSDYFYGAVNYSSEYGSNITVNIEGDNAYLVPDSDFNGTTDVKFIAYSLNSSVEGNLFNISFERVDFIVDTINKNRIRVGERVKWVKNVTIIGNISNFSLELPHDSSNISVIKKSREDSSEEDITPNVKVTGAVSAEIELGGGKSFVNKIFGSIKSAFVSITGRSIEDPLDGENSSVILDINDTENAESVSIEYETPAPVVFEENSSDGKLINIYAPSELNYTNILAYSYLEENLRGSNIQLVWKASPEDALLYYESLNESVNESLVSGEVDESVDVEVNDSLSEDINESLSESVDVEVNDSLSGSVDESLVSGEVDESLNESVNESLNDSLNEGGVVSEKVGEILEDNGLSISGRAVDSEDVVLDVEVNDSLSGDVNDFESNESIFEYVDIVIPFDSFDLDNDSVIDYIEWNVMHLSNQTYSITITNSSYLSIDDNITIDGNYAHLKENNAVIPYDSLVGYWSFDIDQNDSLGSSRAWDLSKNNNDGTYDSAYWLNNGLYAGGVNFDGDGDNVGMDVSTDYDIFGTQPLTISVWMKSNAPNPTSGDYYAPVSFSEDYYTSTTFDKLISISDSGLPGFLVYDGSIKITTGTTNVLDDEWYLLTGVYNGTHILIHVNGQLEGTPIAVSGTFDYVTPRIILSQLGNGALLDPYNGTLDEVMIFNTSLNSSQILAIYNNQSARFRSEGVVSGKSIPINAGDATYGLSVNNYEREFDSEISARLGEWDVSHGYKDYDLGEHWGEFDGDGDYVDTGYDESLNITNAITVSAWVKPNNLTTSNYPGLVGRNNGAGFRNYQLIASLQGGNAYFSISGDGTASAYRQSTTPLSLNQWNYLVGVYNGTDIIMYLNGILSQGTLTGTVPPTIYGGGSTSLLIGDFVSNYFNGSIDEVMIFNRSLTSDEISELYSLGRDIDYYDDANLVSWWGFDNYRNATTIADKKGTNTGTLVGNVSINSTYTPDVASGLVGYWHLDSNPLFGENATHVYDFSGNGNNGTAVGNVTFNSSCGYYDKGGCFDGVSGYVNIPDSTSLKGMSQITIGGWITPNSKNDWGEIIDKKSVANGNTGSFSIYFDSSADEKLGFEIWNETARSNQVKSNSAIPLNMWTFFTGVYDGTTVILYINGVKQTSNLSFGGTVNDTLDVLTLSSYKGSSRFFNGSIDEVMIFNRSLSASEINELYIKGRAKFDYFNSGNDWQELNAVDSNDNSSLNIFNIDSSTSSVLPQFKLTAGANQFYTPFVIANPETLRGNATISTDYAGINSCGDLDVENAVYKLGQNVNSSGTCFNILANNVTLDCQGYMINYSTADAGYAVNNPDFNFTTIKNCDIREARIEINGNKGIVINGYNITVQNNSIWHANPASSGAFSIYSSSGGNNKIIGNNITIVSQHGAHFILAIDIGGSSGNNNISGNTIYAGGGACDLQGLYSIIAIDPYGNIIENNNVTSMGAALPLGLSAADNNIVRGNIFNVGGVCSGISIRRGTNNTLTNNQINTSQGQSYMIYDSTSMGHYNQSIDSSNLAEGKPVNYTFNGQNLRIENSNDEYGQIICAWCNNVTYNNVTMNEGDGINLFYTSNSTVSNSVMNTSKGYGVYLYQNSMYNNILNNSINTSGSYGYGVVLSTSANYNNLTGNDVRTSGSTAYTSSLSGSSYNILDRNSFLSSSSYAFVFGGVTATSNTISNSNITSTSEGGHPALRFSTSGGATAGDTRFINNTLRSNYWGMEIQATGHSHYFLNTNIYSVREAIYLPYGYVYLNISDSILNSSSGSYKDFKIEYSSPYGTGIFNFTNVTRADGSPINITWGDGANGTLLMNYYLDANVTYLGSTLDNATVGAKDNLDNIIDSGTTVNGSARLTLLEYMQNATNKYYSTPYTVNASHPSYATYYSNESVNFTNNFAMDIDLGLASDATPISCGDLTLENTVYTLTQDVNSSGTCFNILANNVTLDCQGYMINYSQAGVLGYGVNVTGFDYATVKGCEIYEGSFVTNDKYGIRFSNSDNSNIINNNITTLSVLGHGIIFNSANNNLILNNTLRGGSSGYSGIRLSESNSNNISSNIVYTSATNSITDGIYIYGSNNIIQNNLITGIGSGILLFATSLSNLFDNNTIISTESSISPGIYSDRTSGYNTFTNNKINSSGGPSYVVYGTAQSHYNQSIDSSNLAEGKPVLFNFSVNDSVILENSNDEYGQIICAWCNNVTYNNVTMNEGDGINLFYTSNSTISNSVMNTSKGYGVYLYQNSMYNNILNNSINTSGSYGYGVVLSTSANYNNLTGNIINTLQENGLTLGSNNIISYNTFNVGSLSYTTNSRGIEINGDKNNFISNNITMIGSTSGGGLSAMGPAVYCGPCSHNIFNGETIVTSGNRAGLVFLSSCANNTLLNMNVSTSSSSSNEANPIYVYNNFASFSILNSILHSLNPGFSEFYVRNELTSINSSWNFTNVTRADGSPINISLQAGANGTLNNHYYLDTNITNDALPVENANVSAWDVNGALWDNALTHSDGSLGSDRFTLLEYMQNATNKYYSTPYTVNVSKYGFDTNTNASVNLTNNLVHNVDFSFDASVPTLNLRLPINNSYHNVDNVMANVSSSDNLNVSIIPNLDGSLISWWRMDDVSGECYDDETKILSLEEVDCAGGSYDYVEVDGEIIENRKNAELQSNSEIDGFALAFGQGASQDERVNENENLQLGETYTDINVDYNKLDSRIDDAIKENGDNINGIRGDNNLGIKRGDNNLGIKRGDNGLVNYGVENNVNVDNSINNNNINGIKRGDNGLLYLENSANVNESVTDNKKCYIEKWKYFDELEDNEKVATLNNETMKLEWQVPMARQVFDNSQLGGEMYKIKTSEGDLVVSPKHKVYSAQNLSSISLGDKISANACSFKTLSPENIGQLSLDDSARYIESLKFTFIASSNLSENSEKGTTFICSFIKENTSLTSSLDNLVSDNILLMCDSISENINSGAMNSNFLKILLDSNTSNETPLLIKAEKITLKSTTTNIFYLPNNFLYFLAKDKLILSANLSAFSCVSCDLATIFLNCTNSSNSDFSLLCTAICQSILEAEANTSNSSGILTHISAINCNNVNNYKNLSNIENVPEPARGVLDSKDLYWPPVTNSNKSEFSRLGQGTEDINTINYINICKNNENAKSQSDSEVDNYVNDNLNNNYRTNNAEDTINEKEVIIKDFSLQKITDVYSSFQEGEEIYFLNSENEKVEVLGIEKVSYSGKIYDVDVLNDIVLVKRGNSSEFWSGNSNNGVIDYMGRNNGTAVGNATQTTSGKMGKAFEFDGVSGYIDISDIYYNYNSTSFWFKSNSSSEQALQSGLLNNYTLLLISGKIVYYNGSQSGKRSTTETFIDNNWHHVVVNRFDDTNNINIWVDGINQTLETTSSGRATLKSMIGARFLSDGSLHFNGSIDDVMIFNRSLSTPEIQALYANQTTKYLNNNYTGLSEGAHTYQVYSQDEAGNVVVSNTSEFVVDSVFPNVTISSPIATNYSYDVLFNVSSSETAGGTGSIIPNLDGSLVSWWRMDDVNSSGTGVIDYMGRNNGTAVGGAVQTTGGKMGKAFEFDGASGYVDTGLNSLSYVAYSLWQRVGEVWTHVVYSGNATYLNSVEAVCPEGMALINKFGGYCIDKYEASMPSANSTTIGNSSDVARINNPGTMMAVSQDGVVPWVSVSQISARTACANAGKHLCTSEEWLGAANIHGQVYDLPTDLASAPYYCVTGSSTYCLDHSYSSGDACNTGRNKTDGISNCVSFEGVYDIVGNVWEWTNETIDEVVSPSGGSGWHYINSENLSYSTSSSVDSGVYGKDGTYFLAGTTTNRAVRRGGSWNIGASAGPFCTGLHYDPTNTDSPVGFRCCSASE